MKLLGLLVQSFHLRRDISGLPTKKTAHIPPCKRSLSSARLDLIVKLAKDRRAARSRKVVIVKDSSPKFLQ